MFSHRKNEALAKKWLFTLVLLDVDAELEQSILWLSWIYIGSYVAS